jgi:hypothetical protein
MKTIVKNAIDQARARELFCLKASGKFKAGTMTNTYWMMEYYKAKYLRQRIQTRDMDTSKKDIFVDET